MPLDVVRTRGLDLDELACLARCNGADVTLHRADGSNLPTWRNALAEGARAEAVIVASYDRSALGQTGSGHFSPVGGFHHERDLTLILDVARFKYPPHWVSAERLWDAMCGIDPTTGSPRGWLTLRPRTRGVGLGFSIRCEGDSWHGLVDRLGRAVAELEASTDVDAAIRAITPLATHLEVRTPSTPAHRDAIDLARSALRGLPIYPRVEASAGPDRADVVTVLLLASEALVGPEQRARVAALVGDIDDDSPLGAELHNVRAQLSALRAPPRDGA